MRYWAGVQDRSPADMVALYGYGMLIWNVVAVSRHVYFPLSTLTDRHLTASLHPTCPARKIHFHGCGICIVRFLLIAQVCFHFGLRYA